MSHHDTHGHDHHRHDHEHEHHKLDLELKENVSFTVAEREARKFTDTADSLILLSWWDEVRRVGGPLETCGGEDRSCVKTYARSHGYTHRVKVNDGRFVFYYADVKEPFEQLDRQALVELHRDLTEGTHDNVMGG